MAGVLLKIFFIGLEFNNLYNNDASKAFRIVAMGGNTDVDLLETLKIKNSVNMLFTPGIKIAPTTLVYLLGGVSFGKIKLTDQYIRTFGSTLSSNLLVTHNENKTGFIYGISIRKAFGKRFVVFASISCVSYPDIDVSNQLVVNREVIDRRDSVSSNLFSVGIGIRIS